MMDVRRLHWQGSTRQRMLRERFEAALASWLGAWSVDARWLRLRAAEATTVPGPAGFRWYRAAARTGSLWLGGSADVLDGFGGRLVGAANDDGHGLSGRVGDRALRELAAQWAGGLSNPSSVDFSPAPDPLDGDARFGACRFVVEGEGVELIVIVDDALCAFLLPEATGRKDALVSRDAAIAGTRLSLPVVLDFGNASLADAHGLQVGDVLVSSTPLATEFQLTDPDGRRLANARLHRAGNTFAIQARPGAPDKKNSP